MSNIFDLFRQIEAKNPEPQPPIQWLIAGLGNPGPDYAMTRHNAGFMALDLLSEKQKIPVNESKFHAVVGRGTIAGQGVLLMKPQTMMNASGSAVTEAARFYKIDPERILVLSDDISLDVGRIRIRRSGSAGGHNGMKSIIYLLNSDALPRVKIGVGQKPHPDYDLASWVLSKFPGDDLPALYQALEHAVASVEMILSDRMQDAMNLYN